jgi:hypothetical protein
MFLTKIFATGLIFRLLAVQDGKEAVPGEALDRE